MNKIKNCEIIGHGIHLPEQIVKFGDQTRYRLEAGVSQIDMLSQASKLALENAETDPNEIDCIIVASAAGAQPIPCTAALLQERIAPDAPAAAFDINSTCTSFITAFDMASRLIDDEQYKRILIASGDVGSRFLNPKQRESYELFSDAGVAMVLSQTEDKSKGVLSSLQRTWPRYAHNTELRGGLSAYPPENYHNNPEDYLFDMDGRATLRNMMAILPPFFAEFYEKSGLNIDDFEWIIPHQASIALSLAMRRLKVPEGKYANYVKDYGNMVSSSVPFALAKKLGEHALQPGDKVMLCGTAAGLTSNILAIQL